MAVKFTPEQQKVIDLRDCNILVSAAAGSGKTAVLTERIVNMISDEEHPVDIDSLLVVTFTNAAAAEMRERIGLKISERLSEHPESEHLQRQATLLHNALITTIDSFCLFLVRNHFNEIGLDPAFRVADEREIRLLQQEVMEELLEAAFEKEEQDFWDCVEVFCHKGKETALEEHILNLSRYAASFPWPEEWLKQRVADYGASSREELQNSEAFVFMKHYVTEMLEGCVEKLEMALQVAQEPSGPWMYVEMLQAEQAQFQELLECGDWELLSEKVRSLTFGRLSTKKDGSVNGDKRSFVKDLRDEVKKVLGDLKEKFLSAGLEEILEKNNVCLKAVQVLIELVLDFDRRMKEKKQERKIIDFSDMEHYALQILLEKDGEEIRPSRVAKQYREFFHEILIDEYQDSNLVQEFLLKAVSGEEDGRFNRFMVGDVKQSIYRFRLARPELFLEKYNCYQEEGTERRIDLAKNFRSRDTVIHTVNAVFEAVMSEKTGGIPYDERAALYVGAQYPEYEPLEDGQENGMQSEFLVVEKPGRDAKLDSKKAEAYAIAARIRKLMQGGLVTDKDSGELRPVQYRDMVILLRSLSGWGEEFRAALEEQGIPAYVSSKSGYFTASEVQDLLNYLRVVDNPLQDIPLFGALRSCFGGFSEEEIARIRGTHREGHLFDALKKCGEERAQAFLSRLDTYRDLSVYLPVRALLMRITGDYDYVNYVTALPGGGKRRANVEMLFEKASDFERTSYTGLFHFIRYMEQLEKYDEDYGEADTLEENADVVRLMSIHKSKGLEFPVVFVSALSKEFNSRDMNQAVILDMDLGIGMDYVDPVRRLRSKTLRKNIVAGKLREDTMAEELRLFYVALTRAKEKLILTAVVDKPEEKLLMEEMGREKHLTFLDFITAGCYVDFLKPVLKSAGLLVQTVHAEDLKGEELEEQLELGEQKEILLNELVQSPDWVDAAALEEMKGRFAFRYPYEKLQELYTKTTVSELKIAAMSQKDEAAFHAFEEKEIPEYVPEFRREGEKMTGAVRGNAYHRAMELMDFERILGAQPGAELMDYDTWVKQLHEEKMKADLKEFLLEQVEILKLPEEYYQALRLDRLCLFLKSRTGYRMWRAHQRGELWREQPFVLAVPATRLRAEFPAEEKVLIQGIIDVFFVENGEIVLLDYKTDVIPDMQALWNRYATQIDYYQEALERLTEKRVKERILYSFHLGSI